MIGEVQSVTSHLYRANLTRPTTSMSGGENPAPTRARLRGAGQRQRGREQPAMVPRDSVSISPGDTIVVPLDTEHMPPLPMWQAITQILYNVAIAAAAVHSSGPRLCFRRIDTRSDANYTGAFMD